jgi:hypothetical protein
VAHGLGQAGRVTIVRALAAMLLLLNGLAVPPVAGAHGAAGAATDNDHRSHHLPSDSRTDPAHDRHSAGTPGGECCEAAFCDCGCASPQAATLPVLSPQASWHAASPRLRFAVKSFLSNPRSAPFRPPA